MSRVVLGEAPLVARRGPPGRVPVAVVAAHPDDETIGASALLLRSPGCAVIHLTDGAPRDRSLWPAAIPSGAAREDYAAVRRAELERALAIAGVARERQLSLGAVDQEAALELVALSRALAAVLADLRPKRVVTHPYEGGHPDHDAAAFVARAALQLVRRAGIPAPPLYEMTSYHARADGSLETLVYLDAADVPVHTRVLGPVERRAKDAMLAAFETQRDVIAWFPREIERLRRAPAADFDRAPHAGALWYERMGFPIHGARWRALAGAASAQLARDLGLRRAEAMRP